jgi:hypothetical protein
MTEASKELLDTLKYLARHYVGILEHGRDRIIDLGGQCDPLEVMESGDPHLRIVREIIAKHERGPPAQLPHHDGEGEEKAGPLTYETFWERVRETGWNPSPDELRKLLVEAEALACPACNLGNPGVYMKDGRMICPHRPL